MPPNWPIDGHKLTSPNWFVCLSQASLCMLVCQLCLLLGKPRASCVWRLFRIGEDGENVTNAKKCIRERHVYIDIYMFVRYLGSHLLFTDMAMASLVLVQKESVCKVPPPLSFTEKSSRVTFNGYDIVRGSGLISSSTLKYFRHFPPMGDFRKPWRISDILASMLACFFTFVSLLGRITTICPRFFCPPYPSLKTLRMNLITLVGG